MDTYEFRFANINDVNFLATVIIEAEKSMTNVCGLSTLFELSEEEIRRLIILMLKEEVDGCEFSISSFMIATYNSIPVAALGGWLEGYYDEMPSAILKANLINYTFPRENILIAQKRHHIIDKLQFEREKGTYQFEYSYVDPKHRGNRLINRLMEKHFEYAKTVDSNIKKAYLQPFENNPMILKVHSRLGFKVIKRYVSNDPDVLNYMPFNVKLLMEKIL